MTTVINTPLGGNDDSGSAVGIVAIVIILIVVIGLFFVFVWPTMQDSNEPTPAQDNNDDSSINIDVILPNASTTN